MPRVIGLTGGIASGKSTVAGILRSLGAEVIDADQVARDVVEPGQPALDEIKAAFGADLVDAGGHLDRKRLAALIFADADKRKQLNRITHPRIAAETGTRVRAAGTRGVEVVIYEAALLVENGLHKMLDGLIVVAAEPAAQLARLALRDALSDEDSRKRLAAQAPLEDKLAVADFVILNDGAPGALHEKVAAVWAEIVGGAPRSKPVA